MDRFWFLTSTTYGTWLPGDERGSVTTVLDGPGPRKRHNIPGTACDEGMPGLHASAHAALKDRPVYLSREQAEALLAQFQETAEHRGWLLLAVAIMANHFHILIGVRGDPEPDAILGNFKSYGSRALNRRWGKPASGTWWTEGGSKRKKVGEPAVRDGIQYIREQEYPLVIWVNPGVETASWPWPEWQPARKGASGGR
jgi:REP element-mobilizing transposase RayT